MRKRILVLFLLFPCLSLWAVDFGLILNMGAGYGGAGKDGVFDYSFAAVPRVTGLIGKSGDFIVSGGIETDYDDGWNYAPELLRTELSFHQCNWAFQIGRMYHADPLGFIAEGLFDGVKLTYNCEAGTFSAGAWYTGLLYKKRTVIEMTDKESEAYNAPIDYGDFWGTYFSPKRFLGALAWEHLGGAVQARASVLGQFDFFSGKAGKAGKPGKPLHSQYAVLKLTFPVSNFSFDFGGCLELLQNDGELETAFAAEAGIAFTPQTCIKNRLSLLARHASGGGNGKDGHAWQAWQACAFLPFTSESRWNIFRVKHSGLSLITLDYAARFHPAFSAGLSSTYLIRNDLETYKGYPYPSEGSGGYFLGNEFFARVFWSPASDLQASLGGGIFLPSLGDAAPEAGNFWRVELSAVFALF